MHGNTCARKQLPEKLIIQQALPPLMVQHRLLQGGACAWENLWHEWNWSSSCCLCFKTSPSQHRRESRFRLKMTQKSLLLTPQSPTGSLLQKDIKTETSTSITWKMNQKRNRIIQQNNTRKGKCTPPSNGYNHVFKFYESKRYYFSYFRRATNPPFFAITQLINRV